MKKKTLKVIKITAVYEAYLSWGCCGSRGICKREPGIDLCGALAQLRIDGNVLLEMG